MIWEDLEKVLESGQTLSHASRARSASTAAGYASVHAREQAAVIAAALGEKVSRDDFEAQVELAQEASAQA